MTSRAWQQRLKWTVYALLVANFALYLVEDAGAAPYTLGADPGPVDWMRAYVTSIDVAAWLVLILCFELETCLLPERVRTGALRLALHGVRLVCCVAILHTTTADARALAEFRAPRSLPAAADLCAYTGGWSFLSNRDYTRLDGDNCREIAAGPDFYAIGSGRVITDTAGLREGLVLAWTDLAENLAWLLIVLANEVVVRLPAAGRGRGGALPAIDLAKAAVYAVIVGIACYWAWKGQLLYFWDELLWVCGFLAIERNLVEWRAAPRTPGGIAVRGGSPTGQASATHRSASRRR
jgi:hypothetical protein